MNGYTLRTRITLVVLVALLALPIAQTAFPVAANNRSRTITRTFANPEELTIPNMSAVSPASWPDDYPSPIAVSGLKGRIRDVNLTINLFTHTFSDEAEMLLVGPRGQTAIVLANVGGSTAVDGVILRLDDEAAAPLPDVAKLQSGTFRPTNARGSAIAFNAPAPEASANAALSVFDGSNPNGTWRLFIQDEYGPTNGGEIGSGWTLEITTKVKAKKNR